MKLKEQFNKECENLIREMRDLENFYRNQVAIIAEINENINEEGATKRIEKEYAILSDTAHLLADTYLKTSQMYHYMDAAIDYLENGFWDNTQ